MRFGAVVMAGLIVAAGVAQAQQTKATDPQIPTTLQNKTVTPTQQEQRQKAIILLNGMIAEMNGSACPGALQARQQAIGGDMIWTTAFGDQIATAPSRQGLGIHVEFENTKTAVKALELRVDYLPLGLHELQVAQTFTNTAPTPPRERTKTFHLDREAAMFIGADLLIGPAATITRVDLVSVTFADGAVWRAPSEDACSVVPSRLMLVASMR